MHQDYEYYPVRSIAEASTTGHGTNIITGTPIWEWLHAYRGLVRFWGSIPCASHCLAPFHHWPLSLTPPLSLPPPLPVGVAVGMKSTVVPSITVSIAVVAAYHLGRTSGVGSGHNAGLFGTAVATMGMLSSAVYVLSMNNYGPIADNAGGIAEMSQQPEFVRESTDRLDAAGNVTKAITKGAYVLCDRFCSKGFRRQLRRVEDGVIAGVMCNRPSLPHHAPCLSLSSLSGYSIGSASLACFLLFGAFMDEFSQFSGKPFRTVDIAVPEVLIGGLLGQSITYISTHIGHL